MSSTSRSACWTGAPPKGNKRLPKESANVVGPKCCTARQTIVDLLPKVNADDSNKDGVGGGSKSTSPGFAKQIAELQWLEQLQEAGNSKNNNINKDNVASSSDKKQQEHE